MKTTVTRVFCAYVLVAGILVYPILKMIEAYSLAAGGSLRIEQTCALCSGQYQPEPSIILFLIFKPEHAWGKFTIL